MDNPWVELPSESPYILAAEKEMVDRFNAFRKRLPKHRIITDLMPEPYLGDPFSASIILLNLNPGYSPKDYDFYMNASVRRACLDNLLHKSTLYPFFLLNPSFKHFSGPTWWCKKLNALIAQTSVEQVAQKVCCIEYFPYHSLKFGAGKLDLKSQQYSFQLVRQAVANNKIILIMRARHQWDFAVPELKTYNCYRLNSAQGAWITPNNVRDHGFNAIVQAISH